MILVNGNKTSVISVNDRGFLYGDGIFETVLVKDCHACYLDEHLERLYISCDRLKIKAPELEILKNEVAKLVKSNDKAVLKIIVTRGKSCTGLKTTNVATATRVLKISPYPQQIYKNMRSGIKLKICETRLSTNPAISGMKLLNWLEPALANLELGDNYQEGLMLNEAGFIVEGTVSNFFAIKDDIIYTPNLDQCGLPGIMRKKVINIADEFGFKVIIDKIKPCELENFIGCFTSNSLGIFPVSKINQIEYRCHDIVNKLIQKLV